MTTTMEPETIDITEEVTPEPVAEAPAEPVCQTFTGLAGNLKIEAKDEAEALRKYKRLVRATALEAQAEQGWCASGTNERLARLGVRRLGEGQALRVEVTAKRIMYLTLDADNRQEAVDMVASGEEDVLVSARAMIGNQFTVVDVALPAAGEETYAVGEPDTTPGNNAVGTIPCSAYQSGYYCHREAGHGGDHASGNGQTITRVWA